VKAKVCTAVDRDAGQHLVFFRLCGLLFQYTYEYTHTRFDLKTERDDTFLTDLDGLWGHASERYHGAIRLFSDLKTNFNFKMYSQFNRQPVQGCYVQMYVCLSTAWLQQSEAFVNAL